ncbi:MAG: PorT family protein [Bacteroidales bacterium]|nr:PorT family protein [Bacteroidales bacterium]
MMQKFLGVFFLMLFLSNFAPDAFSQEDCGSKLVEAQKLYRQGIIEEIPGMLKPCIESGFTRLQRNEAYKILILAYLFDGDQMNAESTMVEFLKKNPEYEVMPNDPVEFVSLFESFRTLSVFSFGLRFGTNFTNPRIIEQFSALNTSHTDSKNITGAGYHVGVSINQYVAKRIFLNLGINYVHSSYKFLEESVINPGSPDPATISTSLKEFINLYEVPVSLGYEIEYKGLNFYLKTGLGFNKVSGVSAIPESGAVGAEITMTPYRKNILYTAQFGAGLKYKIPRGYLIFDLKYQYGLNNIVMSDLRYTNDELIWRYNYVDDDFSLNAFSISAGYNFSFYQPKKR